MRTGLIDILLADREVHIVEYVYDDGELLSVDRLATIGPLHEVVHELRVQASRLGLELRLE